MPEVNLLRDTQNPDDPTKKPVRPKPEFEVSEPAAEHGLGRIFKSMLGRGVKSEAPQTSRMGLGKSKSDQRILKETKTARPNIAPLPDEDENLDVNLLTEEILNRQKPREQLIRLGLIALAAAILVGLTYGGLAFAQKSVTSQITESRTQLAAITTQIDALGGQRQTIQETAQKITAIRGLVERHVRWTRFFSLMEKYTLPTVSYGTQFTGDIGGSLTFSARTSSYDELAKQFLVYQQAVTQQELLSDFSITGAAKSQGSTGSDQITFSVTMSILPSAFENTSTASDAELSVLPNLAQLTIFHTYLAGLCYLQSQPDDMALLPAAVRTNFQQVISSLTAENCQEFSATDQENAHQLLQTDQDHDGLNALLEGLIETSDATADSNGDSQSDLNQFLSELNPTTS